MDGGRHASLDGRWFKVTGHAAARRFREWARRPPTGLEDERWARQSRLEMLHPIRFLANAAPFRLSCNTKLTPLSIPISSLPNSDLLLDLPDARK